MIKVDYEVLKPVFDAREAEGNEVVIHPEKDIVEPYPLDWMQNNIVSKEFLNLEMLKLSLKKVILWLNLHTKPKVNRIA